MQPDLLRAALEAIILEVIDGGATNGYEIARAIQQQSDGQLLAKEGTLYPALHRLKERGLLTAKWSESPEGRQRKHYRLTAAARDEWVSFAAVVNRILGVTCWHS